MNCADRKQQFYGEAERLIREYGPHVYELYAVLVHSGGAAGGHYFAYVKDMDSSQWYNFNDAVVKEIDEETVLAAAGGSNVSGYMSSMAGTCAYMLMYRKVMFGEYVEIELASCSSSNSQGSQLSPTTAIAGGGVHASSSTPHSPVTPVVPSVSVPVSSTAAASAPSSSSLQAIQRSLQSPLALAPQASPVAQAPLPSPIVAASPASANPSSGAKFIRISRYLPADEMVPAEILQEVRARERASSTASENATGLGYFSTSHSGVAGSATGYGASAMGGLGAPGASGVPVTLAVHYRGSYRTVPILTTDPLDAVNEKVYKALNLQADWDGIVGVQTSEFVGFVEKQRLAEFEERQKEAERRRKKKMEQYERKKAMGLPLPPMSSLDEPDPPGLENGNGTCNGELPLSCMRLRVYCESTKAAQDPLDILAAATLCGDPDGQDTDSIDVVNDRDFMDVHLSDVDDNDADHPQGSARSQTRSHNVPGMASRDPITHLVTDLQEARSTPPSTLSSTPTEIAAEPSMEVGTADDEKAKDYKGKKEGSSISPGGCSFIDIFGFRYTYHVTVEIKAQETDPWPEWTLDSFYVSLVVYNTAKSQLQYPPPILLSRYARVGNLVHAVAEATKHPPDHLRIMYMSNSLVPTYYELVTNASLGHPTIPQATLDLLASMPNSPQLSAYPHSQYLLENASDNRLVGDAALLSEDGIGLVVGAERKKTYHLTLFVDTIGPENRMKQPYQVTSLLQKQKQLQWEADKEREEKEKQEKERKEKERKEKEQKEKEQKAKATKPSLWKKLSSSSKSQSDTSAESGKSSEGEGPCTTTGDSAAGVASGNLPALGNLDVVKKKPGYLQTILSTQQKSVGLDVGIDGRAGITAKSQDHNLPAVPQNGMLLIAVDDSTCLGEYERVTMAVTFHIQPPKEANLPYQLEPNSSMSRDIIPLTIDSRLPVSDLYAKVAITINTPLGTFFLQTNSTRLPLRTSDLPILTQTASFFDKDNAPVAIPLLNVHRVNKTPAENEYCLPIHISIPTIGAVANGTTSAAPSQTLGTAWMHQTLVPGSDPSPRSEPENQIVFALPSLSSEEPITPDTTAVLDTCDGWFPAPLTVEELSTRRRLLVEEKMNAAAAASSAAADTVTGTDAQSATSSPATRSRSNPLAIIVHPTAAVDNPDTAKSAVGSGILTDTDRSIGGAATSGSSSATLGAVAAGSGASVNTGYPVGGALESSQEEAFPLLNYVVVDASATALELKFSVLHSLYHRKLIPIDILEEYDIYRTIQESKQSSSNAFCYPDDFAWSAINSDEVQPESHPTLPSPVEGDCSSSHHEIASDLSILTENPIKFSPSPPTSSSSIALEPTESPEISDLSDPAQNSFGTDVGVLTTSVVAPTGSTATAAPSLTSIENFSLQEQELSNMFPQLFETIARIRIRQLLSPGVLSNAFSSNLRTVAEFLPALSDQVALAIQFLPRPEPCVLPPEPQRASKANDATGSGVALGIYRPVPVYVDRPLYCIVHWFDPFRWEIGPGKEVVVHPASTLKDLVRRLIGLPGILQSRSASLHAIQKELQARMATFANQTTHTAQANKAMLAEKEKKSHVTDVEGEANSAEREKKFADIENFPTVDAKEYDAQQQASQECGEACTEPTGTTEGGPTVSSVTIGKNTVPSSLEKETSVFFDPLLEQNTSAYELHRTFVRLQSLSHSDKKDSFLKHIKYAILSPSYTFGPNLKPEHVTPDCFGNMYKEWCSVVDATETLDVKNSTRNDFTLFLVDTSIPRGNLTAAERKTLRITSPGRSSSPSAFPPFTVSFSSSSLNYPSVSGPATSAGLGPAGVSPLIPTFGVQNSASASASFQSRYRDQNCQSSTSSAREKGLQIRVRRRQHPANQGDTDLHSNETANSVAHTPISHANSPELAPPVYSGVSYSSIA